MTMDETLYGWAICAVVVRSDHVIATGSATKLCPFAFCAPQTPMPCPIGSQSLTIPSISEKVKNFAVMCAPG